MRRAGLFGLGEAMDNDTANFAMTVFNTLIDSWSAEVVPLYNIVDSFIGAPIPGWTLTPGTAIYTVGTNLGNLLGVRPTQFADVYLTDGNNVSYYLKVIEADAYSRLVYKPAPGRPDRVYINYQETTVTFTFFTTPAYADNVHALYYQPLTQLVTVNDTVIIPPGYRRAYETVLALELSTAFGKQPTPQLQAAADYSKRVLTAGSENIYILQSPLPTQKRRFFNILTGETI
jgi:hypothetical protein